MEDEKFYRISSKTFLEDAGVKTHEELWNKAKAKGCKGFVVDAPAVFTKLKAKDGDKKVKFHAVLSTSSEDRHGDIVEQEFVLTFFKKNPVMLDSHRYDSIMRIIGKWVGISTKTGKLEADADFFEENELGLLARKGVEDGYINAVSIGFMPLEFDNKGKILKSELLEASLVGVQANRDTTFQNEVNKEDVTKKGEGEDDDKKTPEDNGKEDEAPKADEKVEETEEGKEAPKEEDAKVDEAVEENKETDDKNTDDDEGKEDAPEPTKAVKRTRKTILKDVLKELDETTPANLKTRKRKLLRDLRSLLSRDK